VGVYVPVYATWVASYPQFATTVPNSTAFDTYFTLAQLYCANTDCAIVPYDLTANPPITVRGTILDLLTAHVAQLLVGSSLVPASGIVGRISDATQGSVSVSSDMPTEPTAAWWNTTQWGAMAYAALAPFRTARYRASPGRFYQPPCYPGGNRWQ
jgi:hypothetical protein